MVVHDVLQNEIPDVVPVEVAVVQGKVEGLAAAGLVRGVVERGHVRVSQGLLHSDALVRIELKHLVDKVKSQGIGVRVVLAKHDLQRAEQSRQDKRSVVCRCAGERGGEMETGGVGVGMELGMVAHSPSGSGEGCACSALPSRCR